MSTAVLLCILAVYSNKLQGGADLKVLFPSISYSISELVSGSFMGIGGRGEGGGGLGGAGGPPNILCLTPWYNMLG